MSNADDYRAQQLAKLEVIRRQATQSGVGKDAIQKAQDAKGGKK